MHDPIELRFLASRSHFVAIQFSLAVGETAGHSTGARSSLPHVANEPACLPT